MSAKHFLALTLVGLAGGACDPDHLPNAPLLETASYDVTSNSGPSVTGRAEFTMVFGPIGPVAIRYTLNAVTMGNGEVGGEVEFRATGLEFPLDVRWHASVLCLTVDPDGKTARIGARIDGTPQDVGFVIVDNGEGSSAVPDLASPSGPRPDDPVRGALDHCAGKTLPLPLVDLERGNLMVRSW